MEAHTPGAARLGRRARKTAYLTAGVAASATIIAGSLSGLNVHVLGFTDWPIVPDDGPQSQVLPDPARGETTARLEVGAGRPAALAIPGEGAPRIVSGGELAPGGTPLAGLVVDGEPLRGGGRFETVAARDVGAPALPTGGSDVDSDGDGLSDAVERLLGTDPQRGDSDGDGIPDAFEVENRMNPRLRADADVDLDGDGISNRNEYLVRANPRVSDSNGDGIPDGQDDSDGDGLPNAVEQKLGLNPSASISQAPAAPPTPAHSKSPGKGAGGSATVVQSKSEPVGDTPSKPAVSDGDRDSDGDGYSNAVELAAGTDPADAGSKPKPVEEPPVEEPPVEEPPVEEPPVEEPPVEEPPVEEPPVEEPPVEEPPVEEPPVEEPPVEQPPVDPQPPVEPPPVEPPPVEPPPVEAPPTVEQAQAVVEPTAQVVEAPVDPATAP